MLSLPFGGNIVKFAANFPWLASVAGPRPVFYCASTGYFDALQRYLAVYLLSPTSHTLAQNKDGKKDKIRRVEFDITMLVHLFYKNNLHVLKPEDIYKRLGLQNNQNWPSFVIVVHVDFTKSTIQNPESAFFIPSFKKGRNST